MNQNQKRGSRTQRDSMDFLPDSSSEGTTRRRRTQAARLSEQQEPTNDTFIPPPPDDQEDQIRYGRQQRPASPPPKNSPPPKSAPPTQYRDEFDDYDDYDEEDRGADEQEALFDPYADGDEADMPEKRHVVRWVVILVLILALLAGITYVGLKRPDLVEPVVQWGRSLISGPTPSPVPSPTPTEAPLPTPVPPPDAGAAVVIGLQPEPIEQPDINLPVVFKVTTTQQTDRVRIVDDNGQILIEGMQTDYNDTQYGRVWNLSVFFQTPYDGTIEAHPGNESGWNEVGSAIVPIKVGTIEPFEPTPTVAPVSEANVYSVSEPTPVTVTGEIYINVDTTPTEFFARENAIRVPDAVLYNDDKGMNGVLAFRGSGMRQNAAFGTVAPVDKKLTSVWTADAGIAGDGLYTWSAQPLIVQWHDNIRKGMEITADKIDKTRLKEVIFPANDGGIYFLDLDDGLPTREPLQPSPMVPFLGAAAIYPQGYPLIAVGSGSPSIANSEQDTGLYIFNLITRKMAAKILSNRPGAKSDELSIVTSPLIDNDTGTVLSVGGNGQLYSFTLNPTFDLGTMDLTIKPTLEVYSAAAAEESATVDSSAAAYGEFIYYVSDGGILQCVNLNTLKTQWALSLGANVDGAIALDVDPLDASLSLFIATAGNEEGQASVLRIRAETGEVVWNVPVSGSIASSPVIGQNAIRDLAIYAVQNAGAGSTLYAINKDTGEFVWSLPLESETSSSPIALYQEDGSALIVQGDALSLSLIDAANGTLLNALEVGYPVIGSPAAFNDMIVVATQDGKLHGIKLE